jgi:hypothetical protein
MKISTLTPMNDEEIHLGKLSVLVGPNNVGKSQFLRDIYMRMEVGKDFKTVIVKGINFQRPETFEEFTAGLGWKEDPQNTERLVFTGLSANLREGITTYAWKQVKDDYKQMTNLDPFMGNISRLKVAFLDAASRLEVAKTIGSVNPDDPSKNLLQALYRSEGNVDEELNKVFRNAFDMTIKLDYSGLSVLTFRVAKEFEKIPEDPRKAHPILNKYQKLDEQGDGFRSFVERQRSTSCHELLAYGTWL